MNVPDRVRLPLRFDISSLVTEILSLDPEVWVPHFNRDIYEGDWVGVALRSVGGQADQLYPDPAAADPFADTEILDRCPALRRALAQFECPVMAARLLALTPGAVLKEHCDYQLGWEDGEIRLHVPVITHPDVEFILDGRSVELPVGECWYLNFNKPHSAVNRSAVTRIHLVVDCVVDPWLSETMSSALDDLKT